MFVSIYDLLSSNIIIPLGTNINDNTPLLQISTLIVNEYYYVLHIIYQLKIISDGEVKNQDE